jgi:mRNA interferase MazF
MPTEGREFRRGEIYVGNPDPVVGHEQGGRRPFLVISVDPMNRSAANLVIAVPLTTTDHRSRLHVRVEPPGGGLAKVSFAMPEMVRSISTDRLQQRLGWVPSEIADAVAAKTGVLVGIGRSR